MDRAVIMERLKRLEPKLRGYGVSALYLYGSYARDEARADSDLDLIADSTEGRDTGLADFLAPYAELARAFPGTEIGFSTRDRLEPVYRPFIEASAVRVFWWARRSFPRCGCGTCWSTSTAF